MIIASTCLAPSIVSIQCKNILLHSLLRVHYATVKKCLRAIFEIFVFVLLQSECYAFLQLYTQLSCCHVYFEFSNLKMAAIYTGVENHLTPIKLKSRYDHKDSEMYSLFNFVLWINWPKGKTVMTFVFLKPKGSPTYAE